MFEKTGIVLKQLSAHKVALLTDSVGRVDAVAIKPPHLGSLIAYRVEREKGSLHFLEHVSIISFPFFIARTDILFWHHVLELCYYFMPAGSYAPELFELLSFLYTVEKESCWGARAKKLYLFKLLSTIGIQAEFPNLAAATVHRLAAIKAEHMTDEHLDEESESVINQWLRVCVAEHPAIEQFKTIHFLLSE